MSRGSNLPVLGGGGKLRGEARARGLAHARAWHLKMKPVFDAMDERGEFSDSPVPRTAESPPPPSPFRRSSEQ